MIVNEDIETIKQTTDEFLSKMTISDFTISVNTFRLEDAENLTMQDMVNLDITMQEPGFLIGQNGKTLIELERVLRVILNKKLQKNFYVKLDINDYQKKKIEYLKNLARESANEVSLTKKSIILPLMSPYERRIIHMELENRRDITTQSQGIGLNKSITISFSEE